MIRILVIVFCVFLLITIAGIIFINQPSFGRLPQGKRLKRVESSPHYREGQFRNREFTPLMTSDKGRLRSLLEFLFKKTEEGLRPVQPVPAIKTDLLALDPLKELLVWFGHSSYLIQTGGKRLLVDPVFVQASPVSFINKPFDGTAVYTPEDMPDIDYLVITHDHWDHLDYQTVMRLKDRVDKIICPLGIGEHFEYWGFSPEDLVELDWGEQAMLDRDFLIHCLPARHFSGRGLFSNRTLWASFLVQSPTRQFYIGGDSGYGSHFAEIGRQFPGIDLAILENGQYNADWRYIHTLPEYLAQEVKELGTKQVLTVHHSKYALARHRWDEPLVNARRIAEQGRTKMLIPVIGEVIWLDTRAPSNIEPVAKIETK